MEAARTANGVEACGPRGHVGSRLFTCFLCGSGLCEKCGIHTESHGNPVWCCGGCEPVVKSFSRMKSGSIRTQLQALSLNDEVNAVEAKQKERKEEGDDDRSTGTARLKSEAKSDVKPEKSSDEVEAAKMMTLMRSSSGPAPEQRPLYRARRRAQSVGRNSNSDGGDSARVSRFRRSSYNTAFRTGSPSRKRKESPTSSPARSPKRANSPARFSLGPPPSGGAYSDGDVPSGESSPRGSPSRGMTQAGFRRGVRRDISLRHPSFAKGMKTTAPTDSKRRPFFLRNSRVMPPQVGVRFQHQQQQQQQQQHSRTVAFASSPAAGSLQFGLRAPPQTVSYAAPHGAPGGVAPAGTVQHRQQPMMTPRPMQYPTSTTVVGEAVGGGGVEPQTFPAPVVVVGKGKNSVYQCPYCARPFSQRCNVIAHIRTHTGEKPFLCVTCNKGFKQRSNLKRHYRSKRHLALVAYAENPSSWGAHVGETGAGGVDAQYAGAQYAGARTPPQQPEGVRVVPRQVAMPQQMYTTDSPRLGASNGPAPARVSHVRQQVPPQVQQQVPPQVQQQPYYGGHLQAPPQHRVVQQQQQQQMQQHQQIQQIQQQQQMQQHQRIQQIQQQQQMQQRQQLQQQRQQHQHHMPQGLQPAAAPPRAPFAAQRPMEGKRAYHAYSLSQ